MDADDPLIGKVYDESAPFPAESYGAPMTKRNEVVAGRRVLLFPWHEVKGDYTLLSAFWIRDDGHLMTWAYTVKDWEYRRSREALYLMGRKADKADAGTFGTTLAALRAELEGGEGE